MNELLFHSILVSENHFKVYIHAFDVTDKMIDDVKALWPVNIGLVFLSCQVHNIFICYFASE